MLKRLFYLIPFSVIVFFSSCTYGPVDIEDLEEEMQHISICVLGNSYSADSFCYVPFILKEHGITCSIHMYFRPSGSLKSLDSEWETGVNVATHYYIDTRVDTKWRSSSGLKSGEVLALEKWDIITLQQLSVEIRKESSYSPYLDNIINKIREICGYSPKIAWFMAYNRANDSNVEDNLRVQHIIVDRYSFDMVLPVATAIFNCQANEELSLIGDSPYGKFYSKDSTHLQEGLPCYTAALAVVEAILREIAPSKNVLGDKIRPDQKWITSIGCIDKHGDSVGINENNCLLAQKAAVKANDNCFEIVPIE